MASLETFVPDCKPATILQNWVRLTATSSLSVRDVSYEGLQLYPTLLDPFIQLFNKFETTLRSWNLGIDTIDHNHQFISFRKGHTASPKTLKTVKINFFSFVSLNFFQNLTESLEELHIRIYQESQPRETAYPDEIVYF